jgi:hypothetical protein
MSREIMQQALTALRISTPFAHALEYYEFRNKAIKDIESELAKPEQAEKQEPVGWFYWDAKREIWVQVYPYTDGQPLYTAPPRKEWVGLTDDEVNLIYAEPQTHVGQYARAIEAKLRSKNERN